MAKKNITFDPDAGAPVASNLTINTGADFSTEFTVVSVANSAFDFTGYSGSSQMTKSVSIGSS